MVWPDISHQWQWHYITGGGHSNVGWGKAIKGSTAIFDSHEQAFGPSMQRSPNK